MTSLFSRQRFGQEPPLSSAVSELSKFSRHPKFHSEANFSSLDPAYFVEPSLAALAYGFAIGRQGTLHAVCTRGLGVLP